MGWHVTIHGRFMAMPLRTDRPTRPWLCLRSLALPVCALLAAPAAMAFESKEHRAMGHAAMAVAIGYLESRHPPDPLLGRGLQAARDLKDKYGLLNECVDYFLHPEKMFAFAWKPRAELKAADLVRSVLPDGSDGNMVPDELMQHCSEPGLLRYVQASHNNHSHFQQDLVISIRLYHAFAVSVAKTEDNPYAGLLLNAISDHYLQDLFAPGHLTTPRTRLTDLPATAMHDLANRMGAVFEPDPTTLHDVLDYLCGPASRGMTDPDQCAPTATVLRAMEVIDLGEDQLRPAVIGIRKRQPMHWRGDGQLMRKDQAAQRTLMLATQVRSILDVIEIANPRKGAATNNFQAFHFSYALGAGMPVAETPFGRYRFDLQGEVAVALKEAQAVPPGQVPRESSKQASVFDICSFGQCDRDLYRLRARSPVLSLSFHRESEARGMHEARSVWTVELSPVGQYRELGTFGFEMAPAFGYLRYQHGSRSGHGPSLRLPFYIPETEFSAGPYVRWLKHRNQTQEITKLSYGLRMDAGFSTYATFFLGYGIDYANNSAGALVRTGLWSAGLRLGLPLTQVPGLNGTPKER